LFYFHLVTAAHGELSVEKAVAPFVSKKSRRTPKILGGSLDRAATRLPTPLKSAEWGTLRGDFWAWQEVAIGERDLVGGLN
jgi:hypothetical protein